MSYRATVYALGLNIPLSIAYSMTAESGMHVLLRAMVLGGLALVLLYEIMRGATARNKFASLIVLVGTVLIWTPLLLVYRYMSESENAAVYRLAEVSLLAGFAMLLAGITVAYINQRRRVEKINL